MAITPGAGYMVDPNNPNAVIPIGSSAQAQGLGSYSAQPAPLSTASTSPNQTTVPSSPVATATQYSPAPQIAPPAQQVQQTSQTPPAQQKPAISTNTGIQTTSPLSMPQSGSVVDLLNMAGMDSSFASRQQLAQQFGIAGYTGTAAQNTDLSKKYLEAYNANKSSVVPQNAAEARNAITTYFEENAGTEQENPEASFFDQYMTMNPVVKSMYDVINQELSAPMEQTSFMQEYQNLIAQQGITALQTEYMNIKNIMDGTEDDIRDEIAKTGGFATESQVQALSGARNKTLLKQANILQQQLALKEDYVNQIMQFSQLDRKSVEDQVEKKLGLMEKLATIQESMTNAARENYQNIVNQVGYSGLAQAVIGNKQAAKDAEIALGLPIGALSNKSFLSVGTELSWSEPYELGGDIVQKNTQTGEIRTAVNVAKGDSAGGVSGGTGGMGLISVLQDLDPSSPDYFIQLMASTVGRKLPNQVETLRPIQKSIAVINQLEGLQQSIQNTETGPVLGYMKSLNPYDFDARAVQAQLQAIVPNLARGVYGEVGVLTDQDIKNYIQTLPNLKGTKEQNDFVMSMTLKTVQRNLESQLETLASAGYDISGLKNQYQNVVKTTKSIEDRLGIGKTFAPGTIITNNGQQYKVAANGIDIDPVSVPIPWSALKLK